MRIQLPTLPTEVMRAISGREGTLGAVEAYIRDHAVPIVDAPHAQLLVNRSAIPLGPPAEVMRPAGPPPCFPTRFSLTRVAEADILLGNAPRASASIAWTDHPDDSEDRSHWLDDGASHLSVSALAVQPSAEEMVDALPPLTAEAVARNSGPTVRVHGNTRLFDIATSHDSYVILQRMTTPDESPCHS